MSRFSCPDGTGTLPQSGYVAPNALARTSSRIGPGLLNFRARLCSLANYLGVGSLLLKNTYVNSPGPINPAIPRSEFAARRAALTCRRLRTHLKFAHHDPSQNPRLHREKMFVPRGVARPGRLRIYPTPLPKATGSRIRARVSGDRATVTPHGQTHPLSHQLRTIPLPCELHRHRRRHLRHSRPRGHDPRTQPRHVLGLNRPAHPRILPVDRGTV